LREDEEVERARTGAERASSSLRRRNIEKD
jgi:hypothetical protein